MSYLSVSHKNHVIDLLASAGCEFVPYYNKQKNGKWRKAPAAPPGWQQRKFTLNEIRKHNKLIAVRGGSDSGNIIWLDLDFRFQEFLTAFPQLRHTIIVSRDDAPERGKLAIRITDKLPRTGAWTPDGETSPHAELISTGKTAVVYGQHYSGANYVMSGKKVISMTFGNLAAIWRQWTGTELNDPTAPKPDSKKSVRLERTRYQFDGEDIKAKVRAAWTAYDVFEHHGWITAGVEKEGHDYRITGHSGLLVCDPHGNKRDQWHHFTGDYRNDKGNSGGDQFDAWAYCTGRKSLPDHDFPIILREMAAAAGIEIHQSRYVNSHNDKPPRGGNPHFANLAKAANDPSLYTGRNGRTDRMVMTAMIDIMRQKGQTENAPIPIRQIAERVNMGKPAIRKALYRLTEQRLITRREGDAGYLYSLPAEMSKHAPSINTLSVDGCFLDISAYLDNLASDIFAWGAKEEGGESLGKTALDAVAALVAENDLDYAELSERCGMSRQTVYRKVEALAEYGIVETSKLGRRTIVHLKSCWKEVLDRLWWRFKTFCRGLKRQMGHLCETIGYMEKRLAFLFGEAREALENSIKQALSKYWCIKDRRQNLLAQRDAMLAA